MQPDGLATLLDLLLDCLDEAIGQVQAHIQQCTCQDLSNDQDTPLPLHRGTLTITNDPSTFS
jgi:hypothetical protein